MACNIDLFDAHMQGGQRLAQLGTERAHLPARTSLPVAHLLGERLLLLEERPLLEASLLLEDVLEELLGEVVGCVVGAAGH